MTWLILTALSIYALAFIVADLRKHAAVPKQDGEASEAAEGQGSC